MDLGSRFGVSDVEALFSRYPTLSSVPAREALLRAVAVSPAIKGGNNPVNVATVAWIARHDPDSALSALANQVWSLSKCEQPKPDGAELLQTFAPYLASDLAWVRAATAAAMVDVTTSGSADALLVALFGLFSDEDASLNAKLGVAVALGAVSVRLDASQVLRAVAWILMTALARVPGYDEDENDRAKVLAAFTTAGAGVIAQAGGQCMDQLWALLEESNQRFQREELDAPTDKLAEDKKAAQLSCIIFIASLASHMKPRRPALVVDRVVVAGLPFSVDRVDAAVDCPAFGSSDGHDSRGAGPGLCHALAQDS